MPKRDVVLFTAMICGLVQNGFGDRALDCFFEMKEGKIEPTMITLTSVLSACSQLRKLAWGKILHGFLLRRALPMMLMLAPSKTFNTCVGVKCMWCDNGPLERERDSRYIIKCCDSQFAESESLLLSNAIIDMYVKNGIIESAVLVFKKMMLTRNVDEGIRELIPTELLFCRFCQPVSHGGLVDDGQKLFDSMQIDYSVAPEMTHFVCMVDLYGRAGLLEEAHRFIKTMPVKPSKLVWSALLSSCRTHKKVALEGVCGYESDRTRQI
uniref:Pentatricopeptide repeat-containing protein n=1 Tax=Ananas comosus var. bracteatus TaxID=296719 RepID=A0A6V7QTD2_ANACO